MIVTGHLTRLSSALLLTVGLLLAASISIGRAQPGAGHLLAYVSRLDTDHGLYLLDTTRGLPYRLATTYTPPFYHTWSADGSVLAFMTVSKHYYTRLHLLDLTTLSVRTLINGPYMGESMALSPDGTQLAYTRDVSINLEIFLLDVNTGAERNLTHHPGLDFAPLWSPDDTHLLFISTRDNHREIYSINIKKGTLHNLTRSTSEDFQPAWSPDGRQIAFVSDRNRRSYEVYVMDSDGGNVRNLTRSSSEDWFPVWSPDGRALAFVGTLYGRHYQTYLLPIEGGAILNLSSSRANDFSPTWSPDGRQIAFVSDRSGQRQLYLMAASGKNTRPLVTGAAEYYDPLWQPRQYINE